MSIASLRITPALNLILPGSYHCYRGRYRAGICWAIAVVILIPTVVFGLIALLLCYSSARNLSKSWSLAHDSLWSALESLPMPSQKWHAALQTWEGIQIADREKGEAPMLPKQRECILEIAADLDTHALDDLGELQADLLIRQITQRQRDISHALLSQFFSEQGYLVSDSLVQEICDHYSRPNLDEEMILEEIKLLREP